MESLEDLRQDMHLWLDGTNFKVSTVVLVKFFLRGNRTRVAGTVEVYRPNSEMTEAVLCSANVC